MYVRTKGPNIPPLPLLIKYLCGNPSGPTLSARYIVPALVDCLGRLAATAASDSTASGPRSTSPDPASRALLEFLKPLGGDPDAGIGGGRAFLVLSQALGDVCMMVRDVCMYICMCVFVCVGVNRCCSFTCVCSVVYFVYYISYKI